MVPILSKAALDGALPKVKAGLHKYLQLQAEVNKRDAFYQNPEFRKKFNGFYRVRRNADWQNHFYGLMGQATTEDWGFTDILAKLHAATGRLEASFASKLYATLNPAAPVIDSVVLGHLGFKLPYSYAEDRFSRICQIHANMESDFNQYLSTPNGELLVREFNLAYLNEHSYLTDQKKLDLVLWQIR